MPKPGLIDVYELPTVDNICNQTLREVISLPKVSMAHVIVKPGDESLLHQHSAMNEVYFILDGIGILYYNDQALEAKIGAYLLLPPKTPHKLRNTGDSDLEHLVLAIPPFNPHDVELLDDSHETEPEPRIFEYEKSPIAAPDGATIYELMSGDERKELDVALAFGFLPEEREAIPHYHGISEEIYYVVSGAGRVRLGDMNYDIKRGSVIRIPTNTVHALENKSKSEVLSILCVSSPAYREGDFLLE